MTIAGIGSIGIEAVIAGVRAGTGVVGLTLPELDTGEDEDARTGTGEAAVAVLTTGADLVSSLLLAVVFSFSRKSSFSLSAAGTNTGAVAVSVDTWPEGK